MTDQWNWYAGTDEEIYTVGPCDSREEVIAEGSALFEEGFFIVEATKAKWSPPSADRIIEDMFENCDDIFGEEYPEPQGTTEEFKAAETELQAHLDAWFTKHEKIIFPTPWAFGEQRNGDYICEGHRDD